MVGFPILCGSVTHWFSVFHWVETELFHLSAFELVEAPSATGSVELLLDLQLSELH